MTNQLPVFRARLGLTQADLAHRAGITDGCVSRIEAGRVEPWAVTKVRIADALSVTVEDVFPPPA